MKKIFILICLLMPLASFADMEWRNIIISNKEQFGLRILYSSSPERKDPSTGKEFPAFINIISDMVLSKNNYRVKILATGSSLETYKYGLKIIDLAEAEGRKRVRIENLDTVSEKNEITAKIMNKDHFEPTHEVVLYNHELVILMEMILNDTYNSNTYRYRLITSPEELAEMRSILRNKINSLYPLTVNINKDSYVLSIKDDCIYLKNETENKIEIVSSVALQSANIQRFFKNQTGSLNDGSEFSIDVIEPDPTNDTIKKDSFSPKTNAYWNYALKVMVHVESISGSKLESFLETPISIKQDDIIIPSNFPENLNTTDKAKDAVLKAFAGKYQSEESLKKNENLKEIATPEQFVCRVLKLKDTVEGFASAGTEIWQVEMFDDKNSLICVAWINPFNNSDEAESPDNAAALANAEPIIFILEPVQALLVKE